MIYMDIALDTYLINLLTTWLTKCFDQWSQQTGSESLHESDDMNQAV